MSNNSDSDSSTVDSDSSDERPINSINRNNSHKIESELIAFNSTNNKLNTDQAQTSFGNIALDKSSNITVGNKNEYYGPVIIKQYHNKQNNFTTSSLNCKQLTDTSFVQDKPTLCSKIDKNVQVDTNVPIEHLQNSVIGEDNRAAAPVDIIVSSCTLLPGRVWSLIIGNKKLCTIIVSFVLLVLVPLIVSLYYHTATLNSGSGNNSTDGKNAPAITNGSCTITELPLHGNASYESQLNTQLTIGDIIADSISIVYQCNSKYGLQGANKNFCFKGKWKNTVPSCKKYCSNKSLFGVTFNATCEIFEISISCEEILVSGTIARLTCNYGYRKPKKTINNLLRCGDDGEWDYAPFRCEQICGIDGPESAKQYIVIGEKTNNTKVPWHVGIYSDLVKNYQYTQICGGTILNAKVVITAAHCFWDQSTGFYDKKHFKVAVGKYYRDYDADEPLKTQTFTIAKFYHVIGYNGATYKFINDVAILVLDKYIEFRSHIMPICINWNLSFQKQYVQSNWVGRVASWGPVSGSDPSLELKVIELLTIDFYTCKSYSTHQFPLYITRDKFCTHGSNAGLNVCQVNSGGGLVFRQKSKDGETKYFLRGIVSIGANNTESCENNKYVAFTNIQYHINFIAKIESEFRPK